MPYLMSLPQSLQLHTVDSYWYTKKWFHSCALVPGLTISFPRESTATSDDTDAAAVVVNDIEDIYDVAAPPDDNGVLPHNNDDDDNRNEGDDCAALMLMMALLSLEPPSVPLMFLIFKNICQ